MPDTESNRITALRELITVLKRVKEQELPFDMSFWIDARCAEEITCNTASCAGGWYARSPEGQARGLYIANALNSGNFQYASIGFKSENTEWFANDYDAISALREAMGLTQIQAYLIFVPSAYSDFPEKITLDCVISRVNGLVRDLTYGK